MEALIKQTTAYNIFCREAASGRLAHAYMVSFEDGAYLREALKIFAVRFFGEDGGIAARIARESYPDCRIFPEPGKKFNAEAAAALAEDCAMRPSEGDKKLYAISSFEECSPIVQNKLLKMIEEPPEGVAFILGAASLAPVLPTILSRVRLLEIPPFSPEQIYSALCRKNGGGPLALQAAESCGGVFSVAEAFAGGQYFEVHTAAWEILSASDAGEAGLISLKYGDSKYKRQILAEAQRMCLAAARALQSGGTGDGDVRALAAKLGLPALLRGAELFGEAMRDLKSNAYYPALLFGAMLTLIQENDRWQKLSE